MLFSPLFWDMKNQKKKKNRFERCFIQCWGWRSYYLFLHWLILDKIISFSSLYYAMDCLICGAFWFRLHWMVFKNISLYQDCSEGLMMCGLVSTSYEYVELSEVSIWTSVFLNDNFLFFPVNLHCLFC